MNTLEAKQIVERLCGEWEVTLTSGDHALWMEGVLPLDYARCYDAIDRSMDLEAMPSVTEFRRMTARQSERVSAGRCSCLRGWVLEDDQNCVTACPDCSDGMDRANCAERYRSERGLWRNAHRARAAGDSTEDHRPFMEAARSALRSMDDLGATGWGNRPVARGEDF